MCVVLCRTSPRSPQHGPVVHPTRKEFAIISRSSFEKVWRKTQDTAFAHIKRLLSSVPVLKFPDASEIGVGAFLAQPSENDDSKSDLDIIAYFSQRFKHGQRHYSASMKECCGVVLILAHWRPYLFEKRFTVITDNQALTHLYYMQDTSNMLTRWAIALQKL